MTKKHLDVIKTRIFAFYSLFININFMQITLEVQSQNEFQLILQYVRLLQSVRILDNPKTPEISAVDEKPKKDFMQYYGTLKTEITLDEIDVKIHKMRSEWEQDFS
jgi:hypothetical protein